MIQRLRGSDLKIITENHVVSEVQSRKPNLRKTPEQTTVNKINHDNSQNWVSSIFNITGKSIHSQRLSAVPGAARPAAGGWESGTISRSSPSFIVSVRAASVAAVIALAPVPTQVAVTLALVVPASSAIAAALVLPVTTASSAVTISAAASASTVSTTTSPLLLCLTHSDLAAVDRLAVHGLQSVLGVLRVVESYEAETAGRHGLSVLNNSHLGDLPVFGEVFFQGLLVRVEAKAADK